MPTIISVFSTADYYQGYIPAFVYCMRKNHPQYNIDIAVIGETSQNTKDALKKIDGVYFRNMGDSDIWPSQGIIITENVLVDVPLKESTANCARFLYFLERNCREAQDYFTTDIDMLYLGMGGDPVDYCKKRATTCYYAHHGPWKKFNRFPGKSWFGDYERLAGGAVYLGAEWFMTCQNQLKKYRIMMDRGEVGLYREADEVMFCNICKEAGLPIYQEKGYPANFRGLHLGDFKPSMEHRFNDREKMARILAEVNCRAYKRMDASDKVWQEIKVIICQNQKIKEVFDSADKYMETVCTNQSV